MSVTGLPLRLSSTTKMWRAGAGGHSMSAHCTKTRYRVMEIKRTATVGRFCI